MWVPGRSCSQATFRQNVGQHLLWSSMLGLVHLKVSSSLFTVREIVNKSAASAASLDYVKFQAVIKSAASAAPPSVRPERCISKDKRLPNGFDPKVKSSKMGLSMHPCRFWKRPNPFSQYLAPLGAKYMEDGRKNIEQMQGKLHCFVFI